MKPTHTTNHHRFAGLLAIIAAIFLWCTGCGIFRAANGPKPPIKWKTAALQYNYTKPGDPRYFRNSYTNAPDKRLVRNEIIDELTGIVDRNYHDYEVALRDSRNVLDLSATLAAMGASAAATVAGGTETKTILSAISTGILGAEATVNKTIYKELATEAILSEMRKLRSQREVPIIIGRTNSVEDYTLNQALNDITDYYNSGFVTSALVSLASNAAQGAETAKTNAVSLRISTKKR